MTVLDEDGTQNVPNHCCRSVQISRAQCEKSEELNRKDLAYLRPQKYVQCNGIQRPNQIFGRLEDLSVEAIVS
jgi:hypothetical protein